MRHPLIAKAITSSSLLGKAPQDVIYHRLIKKMDDDYDTDYGLKSGVS